MFQFKSSFLTHSSKKCKRSFSNRFVFQHFRTFSFKLHNFLQMRQTKRNKHFNVKNFLRPLIHQWLMMYCKMFDSKTKTSANIQYNLVALHRSKLSKGERTVSYQIIFLHLRFNCRFLVRIKY